jgi:hypothetical protein
MDVLMLIHGSPICKSAAVETPDLLERFWHWRGASGQNYIHSVYQPDHCPPLPGAIYVGVKRMGSARVAVSVGRFAPFWDGVMPCAKSPDFRDCDEVHVHLLARSAEAAEAVRRDLAAALEGEAAEEFARAADVPFETNSARGNPQTQFSFAA